MAILRKRPPTAYLACGTCGSPDVHPRYLVGGFLPTVNDNAEVYECDTCGRQGPHLAFSTPEERRAFQESLQNPTPHPLPKGTELIPILPVRGELPGDLGVFDERLIPVRFAHVVDVTWDSTRLVPGAYSEPFSDYMEACGGSPGASRRVLLMDLSGLERGSPRFVVLKELLRTRTDVWLEMGVRREEDIMDGLVLDAERVLLGTLTVPALQLFREGYEMADACFPCLYIQGHQLVWRSGGSTDAIALAKSLFAMGYPSLGVVDLLRLGRGGGFDRELSKEWAKLSGEVYLGGGVREADLEALRGEGLAGGLLDPYTPDIGRRLKGLRRDQAEAGFYSASVPRPRRGTVPA